MNGPSCGDCVYFDPLVGEQNAGKCRRYPPRLVSIERDGVQAPATDFPKTYAAEWCGEFNNGVRL